MSSVQRAVADILAKSGGSDLSGVPDPGGAAPDDDSGAHADDDVGPPEDWGNLDYLKSAMNTMGLHRRCQDTVINTNTTHCVVNDPRGNLHVVVRKRLRGAFPVDVETFRAIIQVAFDKLLLYEDDIMPPHCHLIRKLREFQGRRDLQAEEIARIILYGGLVAIHPNRPFQPCAVTIGIYTVPIARAEASRWISDAEFGAFARREVAQKTVVPGRVDFKVLVTQDLGVRARYRDAQSKTVGLISKVAAIQLVKYAEAGLDDQYLVNDPLVRGFQQDGADVTAQQLQISRLTERRKLLYPAGLPSTVREYYDCLLAPTDIIKQPAL
jgi:hypothetical protein